MEISWLGDHFLLRNGANHQETLVFESVKAEHDGPVPLLFRRTANAVSKNPCLLPI